MIRVAAVVPALDEEEMLGRHLPAIVAQADEVVVSDGGSQDRSVEVAAALGARVISGPAGRGGQLNRGAAAAGGEALLFLHADTALPAGGVAAVRGALAGGADGGAFEVRFDLDRPVYRFGARVINWRSRHLGTPLGDQGHFVRRSVFEELKGYRDWPILEDLDFARRLHRSYPTTLLKPPLVTSARRFEAGGPARTVLRNWTIWALFVLGVSPHRLARFYRPPS